MTQTATAPATTVIISETGKPDGQGTLLMDRSDLILTGDSTPDDFAELVGGA